MIAMLLVGALVMLLVVQHLNLRAFTRGDAEAEPSDARVSVLVPARDEERSIEACVRSLATQAHGCAAYEVLVLDDGSSDATAAIVETLAQELRFVRLVRGAPLPPGWRGKNWACAQLAREAGGDLLLFCDADTTHAPDAVRGTVGRLIAERLDLLSLMPRQRCETLIERITIPLLHFFYLTFFPAFMLSRSTDPRFSAANGQFLLFRRSAYQAIGGHESIRASVVDDLALARRIREEGLRLAVGDGAELVECRMYRSGAEVIAGFSKNLYAALGEKTSRAVAIGVMLIALFVVPPIATIVEPSIAWGAATAAGLALRARSAIRAREPWPYILLHPLSIAIAVAVLFRSMALTLSGRAVLWKGRAA